MFRLNGQQIKRFAILYLATLTNHAGADVNATHRRERTPEVL